MERKARSSTPFGKGNGRGSPMYLLRNSWQSPCDAFELPAWSIPSFAYSSISQPSSLICSWQGMQEAAAPAWPSSLPPGVSGGNSLAQGGRAGSGAFGLICVEGPAPVCMKSYPKLISCMCQVYLSSSVGMSLYTPLSAGLLSTLRTAAAQAHCGELWSRRCLVIRSVSY